MDPLSVTASIVTLITITGSILQYLEQTRARLNPNIELLTIMNAVTDLQGTLMMVRGEYDALGDNKTVTAQESYQNLPNTLKRLEEHLNELIDFARVKLLKNGKVPRLGLSEQKKKQLADIRDKISDTHRNLQLVLLTMSLRQGRELRSKIDEVVIIQNDHHKQTKMILNKIDSQLDISPDHEAENLRVHQHTRSEVRSVLEQAVYHDGNGMGNKLQITVVTPLKVCEGTCTCQCHVRSEYRTPKWLSLAVGTLFYSSTSTPSPDVRPCNVTACFRSQPSSSARFTYYFPCWIMRAALTSTWSSISGKNFSWFVRIPRVVQYGSPCWEYIRGGSVEKIRELLQNGDMSPFDINLDGCSVLNYALSYGQLDVCILLAISGADLHFKDQFGWSAYDNVFGILLLPKNSSSSDVIKLKTLISSEDPYDLQLGPLHQIITGLSDADFQKQIILSSSRINDTDWIGMTPLMWAARLGNYTYVDILLKNRAQIHSRDKYGRTALHFASRSGSLGCFKALMDAGADPMVVDYRGDTPLHNLSDCYDSESTDIALLLHGHGVDLYSKNEQGHTPLCKSINQGSYAATEALLRCGTDVNIPIQECIPPIWFAIYLGHDHLVQLLFRYGASTSWNSNKFGVGNVLRAAALCGTLPVMEVMGNSNIPPVECDVAELKNCFNTYRDVRYGVRYSAEEELAAFDKLLEKMAIPVDRAKDLDDIDKEHEIDKI